MPINKRKVLRYTGWTLLTLALLGAIGASVAYSQRERLLTLVLDKAVKKAKRDYALTVGIGSVKFTGLTELALTNISVVPQDRDSLVRLNNVSVGVRIWPLILGNVALSNLTLRDGFVQVVKRDSLTNLDTILKRRRTDSTRTDRRTDLSDVAEKLINNLLTKIPDDLDVQNLDLRLIDNDNQITLLADVFKIDNEQVSSTIRLNRNEAMWHVAGTASPSDKEYNLNLYADGKPLEVSYLEKRFKLKAQADTLHAELRDVDRSGGEFRLEGAGSVRNLRLNHPALSPSDVIVRRAAMDANLFVGENYVGIDSSSTLYLGEVKARPFVKYTLPNTKAGTGKVIDVQLHTDNLDAQALFNSFPTGLFASLDGIKVAGKLRYDLTFNFDTALPDSVKFNSGLTSNGFKILRMGRTDFTQINRPFVYTPYEKDKPVRDISVGSNNPDYTPLDYIAPDLRNAVLTSEDYNFFTHKGFNEKAFRVSIATNYKAGAFKRGASTVSMQLVKNVFLNRNKTLSRKVEEILIVWLIENGRLVPKERMYEVYLNIIEWGRNVYGIGEAARYYFDKTPAELNLGESIFLAFVIPSPKKALSYFQPDGSLQVRNVRGYFRIIGRIMAKRGLTQPDSGAYGFYDVRLREGLRQQVAPIPGAEADSLGTDPADGDGMDDLFKQLFNGNRDDDKPTAEPTQEAPTARPSADRPADAPAPTDTVKTRKQLRQERREQRRREKEEKRRLEEESSGNGQ
ncbi:transglycosylase domain-containing protein [Fibrella sp. HMF5335]|uniref:Transglycosylase domain-containing protein n=1 Tax=Fibrella rubiginis TaxID=2817060 RepID=A0A939K8L1_9BACT|nr:biosynthetic peptidoglycan transglycosylase [Fibrella rubiginis]MBO0939850.1 transglycosylase domain-containing protein [Fibrella rubiginis]